MRTPSPPWLSGTPRWCGACAAGEEAVRRFATLATDEPSAAHTRRHAEALLATGWAEVQAGTGDPAGHFAQAVKLLEPLADADADTDAKRSLAAVLSSQATSRMAQEDIPTLERVRQLRTVLLAAAPDSPHRRFDLAQVNMNLGVLHKWGNRPDDATAAYTAAAAELDRLVADSPRVVVCRRTLARTRFNLSELHYQQGHEKEGVRELRAACEHFDCLPTTRPPEPGLALEAGTARATLALRLAALDRPAAAVELERVATTVGELHAVRDLSAVQNERLTVHLVGVVARGWLAVEKPTSARTLVADHAGYLNRCDPARVTDDARKDFFRTLAEVARSGGANDLLAVVDEWARAFAMTADELAEAGRVCAVAAEAKDTADACTTRAGELFGSAKALGWKAPPEWASDPKLAHVLR